MVPRLRSFGTLSGKLPNFKVNSCAEVVLQHDGTQSNRNKLDLSGFWRVSEWWSKEVYLRPGSSEILGASDWEPIFLGALAELCCSPHEPCKFGSELHDFLGAETKAP